MTTEPTSLGSHSHPEDARLCAGVSGLLVESQGKDMYLVLENDMLSLVDPMDRSVLHAQPIVSIRVWGVGRDNGR